jgi:hypothetical protein
MVFSWLETRCIVLQALETLKSRCAFVNKKSPPKGTITASDHGNEKFFYFSIILSYRQAELINNQH